MRRNVIHGLFLSIIVLSLRVWAGAQTAAGAASSAPGSSGSAESTVQQQMLDEVKALRAEVERLRAEVEHKDVEHKGSSAGDPVSPAPTSSSLSTKETPGPSLTA